MQPAEQGTAVSDAGQSRSPALWLSSLVGGTDFASLVLVFILVAWSVYAAVFIYRTSAVVGGVRYFLLLDDEMISMRYAANLAHGYGLVWNPQGVRVEGFTNPLWVFVMAIFHLLPVPPAKMSLLVQILGAGLRLTTLLIVWRLALMVSRDSRIVALCAVLFTAFYYPLNDWSLRGSEVALLAPMLTLVVYLAIVAMRGEPSRWLWLLLAATTLVRLDMTVAAATVLVLVAWGDVPRRRGHLLYGGGLLVLMVGAQLLAAWWYFGDPLPNTYYLKMTGYPMLLRLARGLHTTAVFLRHLDPVSLGLIATVLWLRRDRMASLLGAVFLAQIAYSTYVGGDAWEQFGGANRYLAIVMPLFMILLAVALGATAEGLTSLFRGAAARPGFDWTTVGAFAVLAIVSASTLATFGPYGINLTSSLRQLVLLDRAPEYDFHLEHLNLALECGKVTDHEASIAVLWAGIVPYFANRYAIDLLGKNDARVGHEAMHIDQNREFYPGHLKWDYAYSIGELKPDVVVEQPNSAGEFLRYLEGSYYSRYLDGHRWYFRNGSPHILVDAARATRDQTR